MKVLVSFISFFFLLTKLHQGKSKDRKVKFPLLYIKSGMKVYRKQRDPVLEFSLLFGMPLKFSWFPKRDFISVQKTIERIIVFIVPLLWLPATKLLNERRQFSAQQLSCGELQGKDWSDTSKVLEKSKGKGLEKRWLELTRRTSLVILERAIPAE